MFIPWFGNPYSSSPSITRFRTLVPSLPHSSFSWAHSYPSASMKVPTFLALLPLILSALSSIVAKHRGLKPRRGTSTAAAATTSSAFPIAPSLVAAAVAGCQNISAPPYSEVRNDIVDGICKPFTLIFERGTTKDGNIGDIVGPPFVAALDTLFGAKNVAVQGVNNYPADPDGFCAGGSATGSQNMAQVRTLSSLASEVYPRYLPLFPPPSTSFPIY